MTSESRKWLRFTDTPVLTGNEFQTLGAEKHKIRILSYDGGLKDNKNWWAQRPRVFVVLPEVGKIWQATSMQSFVGQGGKFKPYTYAIQ